MGILLIIFRWMFRALRWTAAALLLGAAELVILNTWVDQHVLSGRFTVAASVNCSTQPGVSKRDAITLSYRFRGRAIRQYFPAEDLSDYPCGGTYDIPHSLYSDRWIVTKRMERSDLVRLPISLSLILVGLVMFFPRRVLSLTRSLGTRGGRTRLSAPS